MRATIPILALALGVSAASLPAQSAWKPELRPFVGTSIPTGGLRDVIGTETLFGVQGAAELRPWVHVVGTFSVAPSQTRHVATGRKVNVLKYDTGVEFDNSQPFVRGWQFHAFWGAGAGARTYLYDSAALKDRTCFSGYGSTGIELQAGRTALRAEARDNVFCYRSPIAGAKSGTRNDLDLSLGLAYHFR
jgi:hypothetical protein